MGDKSHGCDRQFVAVYDGTIIGAVRADYKPLYFNNPSDDQFTKHECGEINDVGTLPEYRQMGIARELLRGAIDYMMDQGWDVAILQADPSYHARALYKSEGFKVLPSTWDIWHVAFGKFKTIWKTYPFLALIFPLLKGLTRMIAPQPPKSCKALVKMEHPAKKIVHAVNRDHLKFSRVTGDIALHDPWVKPWIEGIHEQKKYVQGIYQGYLDSVLLKKEVNEQVPENMLEKFKKNKQLKEFVRDGGTRFNFILAQHGIDGGKGMLGRVNSGKLGSEGIIGGLRYKIDDLSYGPLKIAVPMLDTIFLRKGYKNQGIGTLLLEKFREDVSGFFPVVLSKAGSGNVALRKALKKSRFHEIIGVITMVRPLNDKQVYQNLENAIEPWLLV